MLKANENAATASIHAETVAILRNGRGMPQASASEATDSQYLPTCNSCFVREIGACPGFGVKSDPEADRQRGLLAVASQIQVFPARKSIQHQRDASDTVPVICSGWAASSITMPNGRRQIVSFLLAGETASMNYFFEPCAGRALDAVSPVSCRKFRRAELQQAIVRSPSLLALLGRALSEERERGDQLNLDLSRRSAEARIARLLCSLVERLRQRGLAQNNTIEFPIRQQQLADATGLTAVHVCKILSRFRTNRFLKLDGRRLTILDEKGLRELVEWS